MPKEKIINKIQKLFARRQSSFAAEAETALLMAQKLMLEHGLKIEDIEQAPREELKVIEESAYHSQTPLWHGRIAVILSNNFRCKCIWTWQYRNGKKIKIMTFIGFPEDAAITKEAYMYAIALVNYNVRCIKKRYPRVTRAYINTYIDGFISGLNAKFKEQVDREKWGLILVTPVPVKEKFESLNPVITKPKGKKPEKSKNENAFNKGYQDGKTFDHNRKRVATEQM